MQIGDIIGAVIARVITGKKKTVTEDAMKLTNSMGLSIYSGERVELSYEEEVAMRVELTERFAGGRSPLALGEGATLIMILAAVVAEIIIICGFVAPTFGKATGAKLLAYIPTTIIMVAIPIVAVILLLSSGKNKAELREAISSGTFEMIDYVVTDKTEVSSDSGNTQRYLFIGDFGVPVSNMTYYSVMSGEKLRCAIVNGKNGRFMIAVGRSPAQELSENPEDKKKAELDAMLNTLLKKGKK